MVIKRTIHCRRATLAYNPHGHRLANDSVSTYTYQHLSIWSIHMNIHTCILCIIHTPKHTIHMILYMLLHMSMHAHFQSLSHSLTRSPTLSLSLAPTHPHSHSLTLSLTYTHTPPPNNNNLKLVNSPLALSLPRTKQQTQPRHATPSQQHTPTQGAVHTVYTST